MIIGPLLQTKKIETQEASDQIHTDALHCSQLQNEEQGKTLEQRVDKVIRRREQKI